jgi:hypothetical protein
MNDANETALKLARKAEPDTAGRLRAWTVLPLDGCQALVNLSYIKEGDVAASVIWFDQNNCADLEMVAGYMNARSGVGEIMIEGLLSGYRKSAPVDSLLRNDAAIEPSRTPKSIH